jgi:ribonuclease J
VVVTLVLDEETGIIINGPDIISRGFVFLTETGHLVDDAQCVILEIIDETPPETPDRINLIRARLKKALKQYFYFTIKRRPVILPIVLVV